MCRCPSWWKRSGFPARVYTGFVTARHSSWRDSVVPVLRLAKLLDLPDDADGPEEEALLVVRVNGERLGLVVGAFREGIEAIVKPMDGVLADTRAFSGTTLLGDGRVLLVLDLRELVA